MCHGQRGALPLVFDLKRKPPSKKEKAEQSIKAIGWATESMSLAPAVCGWLRNPLLAALAPNANKT